ncbi:MAG: hypothetical protein WBZ31_09575 [Thiobacillus sp.]
MSAGAPFLSMRPEMQGHLSCIDARLIVSDANTSREENIRKMQSLTRMLVCMVGLSINGGAALAGEVTGTLGSPSATTTVSGKQLPTPDPKNDGAVFSPGSAIALTRQGS